jgi:hypothetical protein
MNVHAYVLLGAVVLLLNVSAAPEDVRSEGLSPGDLAPKVESLENDECIGFTNRKGGYTLLNFWAAYDAESRLRNVAFAHAAAKTGGKVSLQSVSLDESRAVFAGTVKMDRLETASQHLAIYTKHSSLFRKYGLRKEGKQKFENYLVDSEGMIVAKNISPGDLAKLL